MGMRIFDYGVEVSGTNRYFYRIKKFSRRRKRRLYLEREPDNKRDPNAIKVIGKSKGWFSEATKCVGYVPTDATKRLLATGMVDKVEVRLQLIWIGDKNYIGVLFDIIGPKDDYEKYWS